MGASASREKFRESVSALVEVEVSPDDAEFWDELWKIPSSTEEVFELISPEAARKLRDERFDNLATLFTQATAQLCQIVETPYSIYFDQALNCVRVLTRILPFLLEKGDLGDSDPNVENLCWGTTSAAADDDIDRDTIVGKIIGVDGDLASTRSSRSTANVDDEAPEPLALLVLHAIMHMLFLPQFTCEYYDDDQSDDEDDHSQDNDDGLTDREKEERDKQAKEDYAMRIEAGLGKSKLEDKGMLLLPRPSIIVWAPGLGVSLKKLGSEGNTRKFDKNRLEVLRLLLAACCDPLFATADEYNPLASRWLAVAVAADSPHAICLFYSLLNTIISYEPTSGISFLSDTQSKLVGISVQVLCVLLDCGLSGNPRLVKNSHDQPILEFSEASKPGFNIYRTLLARIDTGKELTLIYEGLARVMKSVYQNKISLLPKSGKTLHCYQEILVLFWKLLEENPYFMNHILTKCDITEMVVPICYLMYEARKEPAQIGLIHICTFLLLKLSGERSFSVAVNRPFVSRLPCDLPLFNGGHADLIGLTLHKLVVNGSYKLIPLYTCFFTIICNLSPYWRSMSLVAAVKLVNLFELCSSPKFLYSGDKSHRLLALLLETFNNIIQYQYFGNQHLVYAILRRKDSFGRLATLTLPKAIVQCKKAFGDESDEDPEKYDTPVSSKRNVFSFNEVDESGNHIQSTSSDASSVLGDHFTPTEEWIKSLKESLPFETITRLLQHLVPVIDEVVDRKDGVVDEGEILDVLKDVTMVGLLPVPHAIIIRKYQPNQYTGLWFTAFLWGVIFVGNQSLPIFDGEAIELFEVSSGFEDE